MYSYVFDVYFFKDDAWNVFQEAKHRPENMSKQIGGICWKITFNEKQSLTSDLFVINDQSILSNHCMHVICLIYAYSI